MPKLQNFGVFLCFQYYTHPLECQGLLNNYDLPLENPTGESKRLVLATNNFTKIWTGDFLELLTELLMILQLIFQTLHLFE